MGRRWRTEGRGPMLALAGVLLLLGVAETVREMADAKPDGGVFPRVGYAVAGAVVNVYIVAGLALVMGGMIYLLYYLRGRRVTFLEAIFNWAVVVAAALVALLMYLEYLEPE